MTTESKYIVFKREDFFNVLGRSTNGELKPLELFKIEDINELDDAVVIRTQDVFAAPALDTYSNSISVALTVMSYTQGNPNPELSKIADYFHERAVEAWERQDKKLPD